jgi:uncharacterized protein HemX
MAIKERLIGMALSAALGMGASALTTWKQVGVLKAEIERQRTDIQDARQVLADHQEDIKKMYQIDGKLTQVVTELQNLRADLREDRRSAK